MASRRAAVLETELCYLEDKIARIRGEGGEPDERLLDLYGRLCGQQKRQCEITGFDRTQKPVPSLREYLLKERAQRAKDGVEDAEIV
jgi:hypothetical protein